MIPLLPGLRAVAYAAPVDMRKGFEGLWALVSQQLGRDVLSGELFVFVGRDRRRAKVLFFDGTGLCLLHKRLEQGRFACLWHNPQSASVLLSAAELQLFLEGCTLVGSRPLSPPALPASALRTPPRFSS